MDFILENLGIITGMLFGVSAVGGFLIRALAKANKAIALLDKTKDLLDVTVNSLSDGKMTKEELLAIKAKGKKVEHQFRLLIGRAEPLE